MAVYVLEDDLGVADSLCLLLQSMGHVVFTYPDAESMISAEPPRQDDTVIVDLGLPGMDGASAIRWLLRQDSPPKVICISGQPQKNIDESLDGIGDIRLLRKPLSDQSLIAVL